MSIFHSKCRFLTIPTGLVRPVENAGFPFIASRQGCIHLPDAYLTACGFYNPISFLPSDNPYGIFYMEAPISCRKRKSVIKSVILYGR